MQSKTLSVSKNNENYTDDEGDLNDQILSKKINRLKNNQAIHSSTVLTTEHGSSSKVRRLAPRNLFNDNQQDNSINITTNPTNKPRHRAETLSRHNRKFVNNQHNRRVGLSKDKEEFYELLRHDWSDDDIGETDDCIFDEWTDENTETDKSVTMIHLGWNESIPKKSWSIVKRSKNERKFTKNLSRCLWKSRIIEKCLELRKNMKQVAGKSRSEVSPTKMKVLNQCLKYWILVYHPEWLHNKSLDHYLCTINGALSDEISYQLKMYEEEHGLNKDKGKRKRAKQL